jgi:phosphoribosylglycinamide formyltransferase 2
MERIMLLGSGELGKEVVIAAKRLGHFVIAVDNYDGAPAMQVADEKEVINMLDADELGRIVAKHAPDIIVPEIEAIRTTKLFDFESQGIQVVPTAEAAHLTMNRDAIREVAAKELGVRTARYSYATSKDELIVAAGEIGYPIVVKPVMSSSGKGQSVATDDESARAAWDFACAGMRGDSKKVIAEEFIDFETEITLLTVKQKDGPTIFIDPIGHRQERGDYQESWMPAAIHADRLAEAKTIAKIVTDRLGGAGIFGVEFFITKTETIFSELSPRPHDTGMVTLISQNLSEFDLHVRAILGLPISNIRYYGPAASSVILATKDGKKPEYHGIGQALKQADTDIRIFGKPTTKRFRRMGVALSLGKSVAAAREFANKAAATIEINVQ